MALVTVDFFAKSLKRTVSFQALIPGDTPGLFGHEAQERGPLKSLYLLHGYSGNSSDWMTFTNIRELSDKHRIAVFMPSGENHFYLDDSDLGACYGEFIGKELVEYTREMFHISCDRDDTFIGGLSMGGYGAIRNGLKYAEQFGKIIALSSAILPYRIAGVSKDYSDGVSDYKYLTRVFGDLNQLKGSDKDPEALIIGLKETNRKIPDLYIACGTEDFLLDVNRKFHEFLAAEKVKFSYLESAGAHTWEFWREKIEEAILWATED
ncbi:alpha/beta hydrolase [Marinicrinis lubricantis]|uniref:Alpha/beta hydrolase n=1 Tax=Marinicrinis lubricantis TaxID=2086470 RepID=A0ABW1IKM1_9BACL